MDIRQLFVKAIVRKTILNFASPIPITLVFIHTFIIQSVTKKIKRAHKYFMRAFIFILLALGCLTPYVTPPIALLMGIIFAQVAGKHPFQAFSQRITPYLLQVAIIGLGFGINATTALQAGKAGFLLTLLSIAATLGLGLVLGKMLKVKSETSLLISAGTAICGGSAIAAVSKAIGAGKESVSVSLATVFILNALALLIFPFVGRALHLNETQFGWWSALAIHDTSSVVGAATAYGEEALQIATTVKLTRALWIVPLTLATAMVYRHKGGTVSIPWFIGLFVLAILAYTYIPVFQTISPSIVLIAKAILTLTIFLIGSSASKNIFALAGSKSFLQGGLLWLLVSMVSLWLVLIIFPGT